MRLYKPTKTQFDTAKVFQKQSECFDCVIIGYWDYSRNLVCIVITFTHELP